MLDTDTRDLVSMHTDGNEIISNVKYSPGETSPDPSANQKDLSNTLLYLPTGSAANSGNLVPFRW